MLPSVIVAPLPSTAEVIVVSGGIGVSSSKITILYHFDLLHTD